MIQMKGLFKKKETEIIYTYIEMYIDVYIYFYIYICPDILNVQKGSIQILQH